MTRVLCKHVDCRHNDGVVCLSEEIELFYAFDDMFSPYFMCLTEQ